MLSRALIALALGAGCYEPPSGACGIRCDVSADTACPDGLVCQAGLCAPADGTPCEAPAIELATISVGGHHVCGLDRDSGLYCWGSNAKGQLGLGTAVRSAAQPTKLPGTWSAIAAGGQHTCGLQDGTPYCWGENVDGQVSGDGGTQVMTPSPVAFGPVTRPTFQTIAAGGRHTCGLAGGQLWCWGNQDLIGTNQMPVTVATRIVGIDDWTAVSLGYEYGCGLSTSMGVLCWGNNGQAQAGFPAGNTIGVPTKVAGLDGKVPLLLEAGYENTCALLGTASGATTGQLWCWGHQLLINSGMSTPMPPTQLGSDAGWSSIATMERVACGILQGHAYCWGQGDWGNVGSGLWRDNRDFIEAKDLGPADQVDVTSRAPSGFVGERFGCLRTGGSVACWGDNSYGQLGLGAPSWFPEPVEVRAPSGRTWTRVWSGERHSCATLDDRSLMCWGANDLGEVTGGNPLGDEAPCRLDATCDAARPIAAPSVIATVDEAVTGWDFTCARSDQAIYCWGRNYERALGPSDTNTHGPVMVTSLPAHSAIYGGNTGTCAALTDGQISCWGSLPTGVTGPRTPTDPALRDMADAGFADGTACIVRTTGERVCWGNNDEGTLGNGNQTSSTTAAVIGGPTTKIAMRGRTGCAITSTGAVECWGRSDRGQAGSSTNPQLTPFAVVDALSAPLAGCTDVAVGYDHSCAVCNGKPVCWGRNDFGQLGRGFDMLNDSRRAGPVMVPDLSYVDVSVLDSGGCAVSTDGRMFCWGDSTRGEVGAGGSARNLPTPLGALPL